MTYKTELERCIAAGMPESDAQTSLASMHATPTGQPYGADAVRAAAVLTNPHATDGA